MSKIRNATLAVAAVGILGAVFMVGGREGYGYAIHKIGAAVKASQYPVVDISYPGKQAVSITIGDICTPYPAKLPAFYHAVYVSPYYQPCGQSAHGAPYQDSPALNAIKKEVQQ